MLLPFPTCRTLRMRCSNPSLRRSRTQAQSRRNRHQRPRRSRRRPPVRLRPHRRRLQRPTSLRFLLQQHPRKPLLLHRKHLPLLNNTRVKTQGPPLLSPTLVACKRREPHHLLNRQHIRHLRRRLRQRPRRQTLRLQQRPPLRLHLRKHQSRHQSQALQSRGQIWFAQRRRRMHRPHKPTALRPRKQYRACRQVHLLRKHSKNMQ
jgi:hypothetical protein